MYLSGKLYLAVIVAGIKHFEAKYACLNEAFTLSESVQRVSLLQANVCYEIL